MKKYIKTKWVDNKTPVNAENLNKIENALETLSSTSVSYSQFKEGNGINISSSENGDITIAADDSVMMSTTGIGGIDVILHDPRCGCPGPLRRGVVYMVLDRETKKLLYFLFNGVKIFENIEPVVIEPDPEDFLIGGPKGEYDPFEDDEIPH